MRTGVLPYQLHLTSASTLTRIMSDWEKQFNHVPRPGKLFHVLSLVELYLDDLVREYYQELGKH